VITAEDHHLHGWVEDEDAFEHGFGKGERRDGQRCRDVAGEVRVNRPAATLALRFVQHVVMQKVRDDEHIPSIHDARRGRAPREIRKQRENHLAQGLRGETRAADEAGAHVRGDSEHDDARLGERRERAEPGPFHFIDACRPIDAHLQGFLFRPSTADGVDATSCGSQHHRELFGDRLRWGHHVILTGISRSARGGGSQARDAHARAPSLPVALACGQSC